MKRKHFDVNDLEKFVVKVLVKGDYPEEYAKVTAFALLEADKKGIFSHGIAGGTGLEESVKRSGCVGAVDTKAKPEVLKGKYPTKVVIDAHGAPGHYTSKVAVELVKKIARQYGNASVFVKNANHYGALAVWSEMIAKERDLVGYASCTTAAFAKPVGDDPQGIDYTKGASQEVRTGTNAESITIPNKTGAVTLDMAWTRMAASYCIKSLKGGEMMEIPSYAADPDYKSTLDPKRVFKMKEDGKYDLIGSIFPCGSEGAGYKGDCKLRMIEMSHVLGGGPMTRIMMTSSTKERRVSHEFRAFAVDYHYEKEEALERVSKMMKDYESKYFGPKTRWPGDRSHACTVYAEKEGIPYTDGQVETLRRSAKHVGLDFDECLKPVSEKEYPKDLFKK